MGKRIWAALAAALVIGLLLAGCGDGEEDTARAGRSGADNGSSTENRSTDSGGSTDSDAQSANSGSGPADSGSTVTPAKAAFLKKANKICDDTLLKVTNKGIPVLSKGEKTPGFDQEAAEARLAKNLMAPALREEVEGIEELSVAPGDEEEVEAFLDATRDVAERFENDPRGAVEAKVPPFAESAERGSDYGLTSCPYG